MNRPLLVQIPLDMSKIVMPGTLSCTMSIGQWDETLMAFYDIGATLIELDDNERPIAAYRKNALPDA